MDVPRVKKGWKELKAEVIDAGRCLFCGACGAFCANISYDLVQEVPVEEGLCETNATCREGYGTCYNLCPQTGHDVLSIADLAKWTFGEAHPGKILGQYLEIVSARAGSQTPAAPFTGGGAITALLLAAIDAGLIDAAITTGRDDQGIPTGQIATNRSNILAAAGTKPHQRPNLALVGEAITAEHYDIGFVGTPCQVRGLRKMQYHPRFDFEVADLVSLSIGTFCMGALYAQKYQVLLKARGVNLADIRGARHEPFKWILQTPQGEVILPENETFLQCVRENCKACSDYTAAFADISAGMFGSPEGWTSLIVRTPRGKQIVDLATRAGFLETRSLTGSDREQLLDITRAKTDVVPIETIVEHSPTIKSFTFRDERIARAYKPGQFVIIWLPGTDFFPMGISRVDGDLLEFSVQKVGPGTETLFTLQPGDEIGVRGPYGKGWNIIDARNVLVVGGGIGIAAITTVVEELLATGKNVYVAAGAKDETSLVFKDRLTELVPNACCTTEDGSTGRKCLVTDPVEEILAENGIDLVVTCGPEPMMKRVFELASARGVEVQASLERFMKCGVGLCGTCCVGNKNDIPVCRDGPVFNTAQLRKIPQFGSYCR